MKLIEENLPPDIKLKDVDIWFQDETRVGQQGGITRVWAIKGSRPFAIRQQQFNYCYIFGAVSPEQNSAVGLISPYVNKDAMKLHLQEISNKVPKGRHAVVVADGASWHQESLNLSNLTLIKLPPYSPQLNPVENVWQWLKQKWLSNRSYQNYQHIVDACSQAWDNFLAAKDIIPKMCTRQWASIE